MIAIIDPRKAATLFWRLAVLRRQVDRTRSDIEQLCSATVELQDDERIDDLINQLHEARGLLGQAVDHMTPAAEHIDVDLEAMRPVAPGTRL